MIFSEFSCDKAEGIVLAHTIKLPDRVLRKGRVLDGANIAALREAGFETVAGARLGPDDVGEDGAAAAVGALLAGEYVIARPPFTGRCNLHASRAGILMLDREGIERLNLVDEAVTIATLAPYAMVQEGDIIATVKIIPFAVPQSVIVACAQVAKPGSLLGVAPFQPRRVALVSTVQPEMKRSVVEKTVEVTRARLARMGSGLALDLRCAHERAALQRALSEALAAGCDLLLVSGASVSKDRGDVVPSAITAAGGTVDHFGMPVEPGNMLLLAHIGAVPVVNLPGCARSPKENGLDWVLERLVAGLPVSKRDIMGMGVGGLIRGSSEDEDVEKQRPPLPPPETPRAPKVAAIVLAAGQSTRMGNTNKLLAEADGIPLVRRVVNSALASRADSVIVVIGHEADKVRAALPEGKLRIVHNPEHASGMASSLICGIRALPDDIDAAIIVLADMPLLRADHLDRVIEAYDPERASIVAPVRSGRRGNPVLWPRRCFAEMLELTGDTGARAIIERQRDTVVQVEMPDDAIFLDVDTPEGLAQARSGRITDGSKRPQ